MSVTVRLAGAVQEDEDVICSGRNYGQTATATSLFGIIQLRRNAPERYDNTTKPALKPDAKIRRMTENNVKCFERPLQSAGTSARLSERTRRRPGGYLPSAYRTA